MKMRILSTLLFTMLLAASAAGQAGKMKQAQQHMDNLNYIGAIEVYNEILEDHDEAKAKINLAEAYRKINDTQNAEFWYGQVVRLPEAEPVHKLYYGMMLQRNGKCDVAKDWYQQYVDLVPQDQRGQFLLRACDYDEELMARGQGIFEVSKCDFNSHSDDFSPQFYKNGLVFSSERDTNTIVRRTHTWTGNPFLELYYVDVRQKGEKSEQQEATCGKYVFGRPEKFSNEINTKFHDASVAFSRNGEEIFFTRNSFLDGKKELDDAGIMRLKIFYARSAGEGKWGELQSLPFNSNEYSVAHPALSPDGNRLFFASDMPGGFGGMDLYYSDKESGRWGPPQNLGPDINTEGHEIFPHIAVDGKVYFASDGHVGLGGLDIFYITAKEGNVWSSPENLGFPVNTISDDFGIVYNQEGTCGFFSSDREGGVGGDDIYSFRKTAVSVEVLVFDERSKQPLSGATVVIACKKDTLTTDAEGKVRFDMKLNDCCDLSASLEEYEPGESEACTKNLTLSDKLTVKIPLRQTAEFIVEGVVFDALTSLPMEAAIVTLENTCGKPAAEPFTTTVNGYYKFKLDRDCCYKIKAEVEGYFAAIEDTCTTGLDTSTGFKINLYLKPTSIASIPTPKGQTARDVITKAREEKAENPHTYFDKDLGLWVDKDTRLPAEGTYPDGNTYKKGVLQKGDLADVSPTPVTEETPEIPYLLHIYYDYDQAYIRDDALPELEKLFTLLQENPKYIIEIGSHTDARASDHYNQRLSQRRAESVVRWLTDKGVDRSRLVAKGYGESVNVNDCTNNIPCSEKQHQMNRRTEFKVIGCRNCKNKKVLAASNANENTKVDECKSCPF